MVTRMSTTVTAGYQRQYRKANRERLRYQEHVRREEWRDKLVAYKGGACVDCGEADRRVLQFDHRSDKVANVSWFLNRNWEKALAEADKCDLVCANCHAIRTFERRPKPVAAPSQWLRWSKESCPQGHARTEANTYRWRKKRYCRACRTEAAASRRAERKRA